MTEPSNLLKQLLRVAIEAGEQTLLYFPCKLINHSNNKGALDRSLNIIKKSDDSPVTQADMASHHFIQAQLAKLTPHIPLLSEESLEEDAKQRHLWTQLWLVDPLDGTREFIDGIGEFTINIALVDHGNPKLGVIAVPAKQQVWLFETGKGVWFVDYSGTESWRFISSAAQLVDSQLSLDNNKTLRVAISRRIKPNEQLVYDQFYDQLRRKGFNLEFIPAGSAYKFCQLASGEVDMYPRLHPTYEWDTAAGQGLIETLGGSLCKWQSFQPFSYNQRDTLLNGSFLAVAHEQQMVSFIN